ncbi:hypothetical protein [Streptomyces sp. NPDC004230]
MTDQTARLLRDAEGYLGALHASVARHDNLAANFGCVGCELRDQIHAALATVPAVVSASVQPTTRADDEQRERQKRYMIAIHDAMEEDLSLVDEDPAVQAAVARAAEAAMAVADAELRRMAGEEQPTTETQDDPIGISHELCPGFPDRCPNLRVVEPEPGVHLGGIRCGCADRDAVVARQDGAQA